MTEPKARAAESGRQSEVYVTVLCSPRSGEPVTAPIPESGWTSIEASVVHQ
jgi:hypothetical protein